MKKKKTEEKKRRSSVSRFDVSFFRFLLVPALQSNCVSCASQRERGRNNELPPAVGFH